MERSGVAVRRQEREGESRFAASLALKLAVRSAHQVNNRDAPHTLYSTFSTTPLVPKLASLCA